ncbi:MAG TPA: pyridoxal-phosphate dependent enzyme [Bryobacteraceae bacterium]|nr:pyridoxal-phosphate dependent enzyme [Bryobacteraceae bacterium]
MTEVGIDDIRAAAGRIAPVAHRTPVMTSRTFDRRSGVQAFFKCENLQRGGAFKIRGATNFVFSIPKPDLARGVVTYSSGNHAQAVAIAAAEAGTPATIVMPEDAPRSKLAATRGYGAQVVTYDRNKENREAIGRRIAEQTGATLAPPYDHPWTIAGQGTVAKEFLEQTENLDALVVCIGGGGLMAGCAIAAKALRPAIRLLGVEPEAANDTWQSFRAGHRIEIPMPKTIADGLMSTSPGALTFPVIQRLVDDVLLVSEEEIRETVKFLLTRMKILVEPSGAVAAAAVLFGKLPAGISRAGIVLSGGNADLEFLRTLGD